MTTAVIGCGELVTLSGPSRPRSGRDEMRALSIIRDGAFLVRDGVIGTVGQRSDIERRIDKETEVIDAHGRVVMPGFVDAHTHAVFAGNRAHEFELRASGLSYEEIARAGGGIRFTVQQTRAATLEELIDAGVRHADWFLRCGTTTIEAKSGYGLSLEDELKILRAIRMLSERTPLRIVPTLLGAHIVPDEYRNDRDGYVDLIVRQMIPRVVEERLAEYCDIFCDRGAFTADESERILRVARTAGLKLRMHADQLAPGDGLRVAAQLRAATADHLEHTGEEGISLLQESGTQPVLLPGSVYALGSHRYANARAMIDAGLGVVLATDFNPGSSPTPSMPMILSIAVTHMRVTPSEAITAATINAAYSLGRGDRLGSIEPGKLADFVIYDCRDYREIAYYFGIDLVVSTHVGGETTVR